MKNLICGVDPGISGAICFYDPLNNEIIFVDSFPLKDVEIAKTSKRKTPKKEIDLYKLNEVVEAYARRTMFCVLEKVHAMPGQGVTSMFRFGESYGQVQGTLAANKIAAHLTPPSVWKNLMGLGRDKKESLEMAKTLFPASAERFKRLKDDGKAEAALLAYYGIRLIGRTF